ncbi:MAG: CBS domain-containing protein [Gammaproteobacteria bacterium]|nr:CBS domain-containing protein [Gammaproteobacteria bacterium]
MPLQWYRRPRLVILSPDSPVLDAARAIEQNRIGALLVQDRGRIVGIVTDRDLAVRVLGRALDPRTTTVGEIMTPSPLTLGPQDSREDAIRLMQECNVRRIPIVEDGRVVGIVTLDDLLLDEAAPLEELAAIVQAQLGEGGPAGSGRSPASRRRLARAEATLGRLLSQVRADAGLNDPEQVRTALDVVLGALVRRLTPEEAADLVAQLPSLLQPQLRALPAGPDKSVTRASIESELASRLGMGAARAAELLAAVAGTIALTISPGQAEDVRGQLPAELRSIFTVRGGAGWML